MKMSAYIASYFNKHKSSYQCMVHTGQKNLAGHVVHVKDAFLSL